MARLLVTGGAGFIGANFVHYWLEHKPEDRLVVLDALTYAGNLQSLEPAREHPQFRFVHGDIRDRDLVAQLLAEEQLDTIVHFAAESHVDRSIEGPEVFLDVNVLGTQRLLEAAREVWLETKRVPRYRFHHVSTDEVYGSLGWDDPPFSESHRYAPNSPYAASKAGADHLVRAYWKTYGLESTISNCSNNYGPYHYPEKLIPLAIVRMLQGEEIPIYGDGKNVRDWLYVEDHCAGIASILGRGRPGATYNLGGRAEVDNLSLIRKLAELMDRTFAETAELRDRFPDAWPARGASTLDALTFVPDRPGHDRRYAIDARRAAVELGFVARTQLDAGLQRTVAWYLDNEPWWRGVMDGSYRSWMERQYGET